MDQTKAGSSPESRQNATETPSIMDQTKAGSSAESRQNATETPSIMDQTKAGSSAESRQNAATTPSIMDQTKADSSAASRQNAPPIPVLLADLPAPTPQDSLTGGKSEDEEQPDFSPCEVVLSGMAAFSIPGSYLFLKQHTNLSMVESKLQEGQYERPVDFFKDMTLTFDQLFKAFLPEQLVFVLGRYFHALFTLLWSAIIRSLDDSRKASQPTEAERPRKKMKMAKEGTEAGDRGAINQLESAPHRGQDQELFEGLLDLSQVGEGLLPYPFEVRADSPRAKPKKSLIVKKLEFLESWRENLDFCNQTSSLYEKADQMNVAILERFEAGPVQKEVETKLKVHFDRRKKELGGSWGTPRYQ
ncbi:hypothetical protein BU16DRAFT_617848 [Lophium mytilinum]|uniref:Uncharacterized protein n=1 Tax=Lophium mytilinum TaxID=390894 RepID=A0A6A6QW42_9PEZI|nr:hypothetical protein BU16DRAFT_617848 [Lophium mytilinum]